MKTYIMMFGIANIVAGGPIYNANKIKFLEQYGWNIVVFPIDSGKIYIKPLEKYNNKSCDFIRFPPCIFCEQQVERFVEQMACSIPVSDQLIVETGTDYTALWGELLANRLKARHIIMFLDEKNENVNEYSSQFYEFKYKRNELYSISEKSLIHIFSPYFDIEYPEKNVWNAWCTNSVENIESDIINKLPTADYMIGSIGRLDKSFVSNIIEGICAFADEYEEKSIGCCLFGGADDKTISNIKKEIRLHRNIILYISDYIWPIPKLIFPKFDVFVSGAGSANVSANMGIPTINMDVITNEPIGFVDNPQSFHNIPIKDAKLEDYLTAILIGNKKIEIHNMVSIEEKWDIICKDFRNQINQIENINSPLIYFDTRKICDNKSIHKIERFIVRVTNYKMLLRIQKLYRCIKCMIVKYGK